ncbi:pilus assembly protein Flp/PilA [Robbsia andropogonis]|uniref:Flp family type IVb pilin n=1 Tax=Robbsia andropogonis TaxID=28092 RepID=UPI003D1FC114
MSKFLKLFVRDERGISAIEYTLLAGIAVMALVGLGTNYRTTITGLISNLFTFVRNS